MTVLLRSVTDVRATAFEKTATVWSRDDDGTATVKEQKHCLHCKFCMKQSKPLSSNLGGENCSKFFFSESKARALAFVSELETMIAELIE